MAEHTSIVEPKLAATLLLAREGQGGSAPELFLVRRHGGNAFMPGSHVFVGGKLDAANLTEASAARCRHLDGVAAAERLGLRDPALALGLYVAGLREAFEEAGVLLAEDARGQPVAPSSLEGLRALQLAGEQGLPAHTAGREMEPEATRARAEELEGAPGSFAELLEEAGLWLDLSPLRHLSRWVTPTFQSIRFDAYFFICRAPEGQRASHDEHETTDGGWFSVSEVLARNRAEVLHLPPPTLCTLERLRGARSVDELLATASDAPAPPRMPELVGEPGPGMVMLLPEDHRYGGRYRRDMAGVGREHYVILRGKHWELIDR